MVWLMLSGGCRAMNTSLAGGVGVDRTWLDGGITGRGGRPSRFEPDAIDRPDTTSLCLRVFVPFAPPPIERGRYA